MMASVREPKNQTENDIEQFNQVEKVFLTSAGSFAERLDAFPKFASRQSIAKFLARYEIFKQIVGINGSIVECGVLHGGGLFTWAKLSSILEPTNHPRKVIGFDTFAGFLDISEKDEKGTSKHNYHGALCGSTESEIEQAIDLYNLNRPISHIPKIELVGGDLCITGPQYVIEHPHLVVSLLYLDVDLYEPTKAALKAFVPKIPKGGIVVFDQLNAEIFPGETLAVDEILGLSKIKVERYPFDSYISYWVRD